MSAASGPTIFDSWKAPKPRLFVSDDGRIGLKVLPVKGVGLGDDKQKATAILFRLEENGAETVFWKTKLVNLPETVFIDPPTGNDRSVNVVTVDTYGNLGYEHSLVLYDMQGKVIKDYRLEDLLTSEEIAHHVLKTMSSREWTSRAEFEFRDGYFWIRFKYGKTLKLDPDNGALSIQKSARV